MTTVAASLFLLLLFLVFISVYISSNPRPQTQNCYMKGKRKGVAICRCLKAWSGWSLTPQKILPRKTQAPPRPDVVAPDTLHELCPARPSSCEG